MTLIQNKLHILASCYSLQSAFQRESQNNTTISLYPSLISQLIPFQRLCLQKAIAIQITQKITQFHRDVMMAYCTEIL